MTGYILIKRSSWTAAVHAQLIAGLWVMVLIFCVMFTLLLGICFFINPCKLAHFDIGEGHSTDDNSTWFSSGLGAVRKLGIAQKEGDWDHDVER